MVNSIIAQINHRPIRTTLCETENQRQFGTAAPDARRSGDAEERRTGNGEFPGGRTFRYAVESSPASVNPAAFFSENEISVRLPETTVLAWANTDQVSISGEQVLVDGETLKILVEKDFVCLTGRDDEDESEMYPHPEAGTAHC